LIRLKCLSCGLALAYRESQGEFCPRCLARDQQVVRLVPVSDRPSRAFKPSMGHLRIQASAREDCHLLLLSGELDIASAPLLEGMLQELCEQGAREVVLDLGGVEFIDSSGLNAILYCRSLCERHRCVYCLTPARRPAQRMLEITGVAERLPFRRDREEPVSET
jgi:anti-sigma B factor antagonist